jgi:L-alanine-DL-glutamate epimerase-like enolase superfamily enzyme
MRIADLRSRLHRVPLPRPWGADVTEHQLIVCELLTDDGRTGVGFSWTPRIGGAAIQALLEHDVAPAACGLPAQPTAVWDRLWRHLREAGAGGVTTLALAALDTALWDLDDRGLVDALGRRRDAVPVYGSGVNRHYSRDELVDQARRWAAAGFEAVKVKVGGRELRADVDRVGAVRDVIGPDVALMVDANQLWDLPGARRAIAALAPLDLHWVEEPLPADDLPAHLNLRAAVDVPIAVGENLYTGYQFRDFLAAGACDIVQPNVARVGGITPFMRIAELAHAYDVPVMPHLLLELSGQLACCLPLPAMVEDVEDASLTALGVLGGPPPVSIEGGRLRPGGHAGHGLRFDIERLGA